MKKFFKGCFITALIFLALGVSLAVVVALVGDKDKIAEAIYDATEGKVEIRLNSWDDFGIHINGDWNGRYDINDASVFDGDHEVWEGDIKKTQINQGDVDTLEINVGGNNLEVKVSEDDYYYIEQKGEGKLQAYEENGVLHVTAIMNDMTFGSQPKTNIIFYVPEGTTLEKINVELGAGMIKASDLNGKNVEFDLGAGYMEWDALNADSLKIEMGAGKVVTTNAVLGNLDVSLGAGDCQVQGKFQGNVKVNCAAGNVSLEPIGKETEFNYDLSCTAGSIQVGDEKLSDLNEDKLIDNNASKTMELSVTAGNVEVEFE